MMKTCLFFKRKNLITALSVISVSYYSQTYQLISTDAELTAGNYLIVSKNTTGTGISAAALANQTPNNRGEAAVTINNGIIKTTISTVDTETNPYQVAISGTTDAFTIFDQLNSNGAGGYLYAASSSANYLRTQATSTTWKITFSNGAAVMTSNNPVSRNILRYNTASSLFSCYSTGQAATYLYKEISTSWNGNAWSNGLPDQTKDVYIKGDYSGPSFTAKDLTVNSGKTLTVNSSVTAANVTNNGSIIVNDGGNFIQTGATYTAGTGSTFTLNKNTASAANRYVFWCSPVKQQNMFDIYGASAIPDFVMTYNTGTDYYDIVTNPTTSVDGKGYSVKVKTAIAPATFTGTPNNGNVAVTLNNTANANGNTWNLIGNPYPSNVNLMSFYNSATNGVDSSMYFWDSVTSNGLQQQDASGWRIFNASGSGTWTNANANTVGTSVKPGQGFIVKATGATATFTNAMRNSESATFVNKSAQSNTEGKYWLKLTTPSGKQSGIAITYGEGAQNTLDAFDSEMMSTGTDAIYSYLNTDKLAIQGRDNFVNTDVVVLGNKHAALGQYTISLVDKTGVFANGQAIYLKDKQLGTYTNLITDAYTFNTDAMEQQNRFEIVYQTQGALGTAENAFAEITVAKDGGEFVINAPEKINTITLYDTSGRIISVLKGNGTTMRFKPSAKGLYFINIETAKQKVSKKIIQ